LKEVQLGIWTRHAYRQAIYSSLASPAIGHWGTCPPRLPTA